MGTDTLIQVKSLKCVQDVFFLLDKHIVPWQLSTSKLVSPLWAQWGEVLASTQRFFTYRGHQEVLGCPMGWNVSLWENFAEQDKLILSLFPSVFHCYLFLHSVFILHPNMTAGVCTGPECSTFFVHQTLCSSSSVTLLQTNHQSWMKNIILSVWMC